MNITNVSQLNTINSALTSDYLHTMRSGDYSMLYSYKATASNLESFFEKHDVLDSFRSSIDSLVASMRGLSATILTIADAKSTYARKDVLENETPQLLTNTEMETILSKYITHPLAVQKANLARQAAQKARDEMTDFAYAAMVGIFQSAETPVEQPDDQQSDNQSP